MTMQHDATVGIDEFTALLLATSTDHTGNTSAVRLSDDLSGLVGGDLPAWDLAQEEHDERYPAHAHRLPGAALFTGGAGK